MNYRDFRDSIRCWIVFLIMALAPMLVMADPTITPGDGTTICGNTETSLSATASSSPPLPDASSCPCNADGSPGTAQPDPARPPDFAWSDNASGSSDSTTINWDNYTNSPEPKKVTITVTYHWLCSDGSTRLADTTDSQTVTYSLLPDVQTAIGNSGTSICAGATVSAGPATGGTGTGYTFTEEDVGSGEPVATVDSSSGVVTGEHAGQAIITVTDSNGCIATTDVSVEDPQISGDTSVDVGKTITLTCSTTTSGDPVKWSETNGTGSATVGEDSGIVTGVSAGTVTITATVNGCSTSYDVTVNPNPQTLTVSITSPSDKTMLAENQTQAFTGTVSGGSDGDSYTYTWTRDDTGSQFNTSMTTDTTETTDAGQFSITKPDLNIAIHVTLAVNDTTSNLTGTAHIEIDVPAIMDAQTTGLYDDDDDRHKIIGEMMHLVVHVPNQTISTYNWTVSGPGVYASWDAEQTSTTLNPLTSTSGSEVDYYYDTPNNPETVQCVITTDNGSCTVPVNFNVIAPNPANFTSVPVTNHPGEYRTPAKWLEFGDGTVPATIAKEGMQFTWTSPPSTGGEFGIIQVADNIDDTGIYLVYTLSNVYNDQHTEAADCFPPWINTYYFDSPGIPLQTVNPTRTGTATNNIFQVINMDQSFTTWLMYKPPAGDDSQWVPIQSVHWSWTGTATFDKDTNPVPYDLSNLNDIENPPLSAIDSYPSWTSHL